MVATNEDRVIGLATASKRGVGGAQWHYLPGSSIEGSRIRVRDENLTIPSQDGKKSQANSPVNLYGTHYIVNNSFSASATLADIQADAYVTLYGRVPITQDEFRVEPPRLVLHFTPNAIQVLVYKDANIQDIGDKTAVFNQTYRRDVSKGTQFKLKRVRGTLSLSVGGKAIASIPEHNIFRDGQVWIGAASNGGEFVLSDISITADNGGAVQTQDASMLSMTTMDSNGLQTQASKKRPGFLVGAAMSLAPLVSDLSYAQVALGGNFGSMTTENALKWQSVEPRQGVYDFHEGDALVDVAARHGLVIHGHTLVFGEANPGWVRNLTVTSAADKQKVQQVMTHHIANVVGHYKSKIKTWDVVNEPIADYDDFNASKGKILRDHKWYQAMGESYIATAFKAAHAADPDAKLFINDYGLEENGDRWNIFLKLMMKLKAQGVPIDGVGFESHVYEKTDKINPAVLKSHMKQLAKIGIVSRISEMDVYSDDGTRVQTDQYSSIFNVCLNEPSCVSFTTWGVSDRYDMFMDGNRPEYGDDFLWNYDMKPIQAVSAIQQLLRR
ncbi:MAG: endo,4-beta-xylanase [Patescibacteria group bacterium]|nr:endo,4-beta-xylanase [Patescibacteria group bacterium]